MTARNPIRLGIVGCGDVLTRVYSVGLSAVAESASVVGYCDAALGRAQAAVLKSGAWAPNAHAFDALGDLLALDIDAVINLTPAPQHYAVTAAALKANLHVYTEKPLALTAREGRALVAEASGHDCLLLCAPAITLTDRYMWLKKLVVRGDIGTPTLVTAQFANRGPALWTEYSGDASVFYRREVGPLVDQGIYLLHAIADLLGPIARVQAFARTVSPTRLLTGGSRAGETIDVESYDHVLLHLESRTGALAQVLSSYGVPESKTPTMEIHGARGSISFTDRPPMTSQGSVEIYVSDHEEPEPQRWFTSEPPGPPRYPVDDLITIGLIHFVRCLTGQETPALTADSACHIMEIIESAYESVSSGASVSIESHWADSQQTLDGSRL